MMMPEHCKEVSVRTVNFPLTPTNIAEVVKGKKAYTRTRYYVLRNRNDSAVISVEKEDGNELFRNIKSFEILSLPDETVFVEDRTIDVINRTQMAKLSQKYKGKLVVVRGMFNHVSFVKDEDLIRINVIDTVPPRPSKLSVIVEKIISMGLINAPIIANHIEIDLESIASTLKTKGVIFPCRASGISCDKVVYFLDETPEISVESTLVGCDLSRRIFKSLYKKEVDFIDICPRNHVRLDGSPTLVKCCKVKSGYELKNQVAAVPWGTTIEEVKDALLALLKASGNSNGS
ncbi:MAG: hypothetical protein H5T41_01865 [Methanomassiliicoccales archaeon]|nr:hypothetical protein [Methanomassiliicoccales archaeon]